MPAFVALLRAINVGGTGLLPMKELAALCRDAGFTAVKTYIQSGNVVLRSRGGAAAVERTLAAALAKRLGKPAAVFVRTGVELEAILADNPFPDAAPNRVLVTFLAAKVPARALAEVVAPDGEEVVRHGRELYVHYPNGMGRSRLKLPAAAAGTARNLNTVRRLAELVAEA
ncbi:MAG: DUF1697 domain-containing protein [Kofleriaceae bacterium]